MAKGESRGVSQYLCERRTDTGGADIYDSLGYGRRIFFVLYRRLVGRIIYRVCGSRYIYLVSSDDIERVWRNYWGFGRIFSAALRAGDVGGLGGGVLKYDYVYAWEHLVRQLALFSVQWYD